MIGFSNQVFKLDTKDTSYCFGILESGQLEHLYYNRRLHKEEQLKAFYQPKNFLHGNCIQYDKEHGALGLEDICLEASGFGKGDIREPFVDLEFADGTISTDFIYESHEILTNKTELTTLPSSYDETGKTQTLVITLKDRYHPVKLLLSYSVFYDSNVIVRSSVLKNEGDAPVKVRRLMSMQLDLDEDDFWAVTFGGAWAREMNRYERKINEGIFVNDSKAGVSSNRRNPFFFLKKDDTSEEYGDCYAFNLVYSGNFYEACEVNSYHKTRIVAGISPSRFSYTLEKNEILEAPEAVMTYTHQGMTQMSHQMHSFIREHIVRGTWKKKARPILLNSWEAAYFKFNESKLVSLAKSAKECGIELFVMDDGWFGKRDNDTCSLGDWTVYEKKLPHGLKGLADKINALGMDFGIWVEPEMISEDSDIYRAHPEYALNIQGREQSLGRNQMLVDLVNPEAKEYVLNSMRKVFESADIAYVKWDMNRIFTDIFTASLPIDRQTEYMHRYYIALYDILAHLTKEFPDILFEGCASGGNRFDLGMLCYMPQIWASDNTDAICRTTIQNNLSYGYPMSVLTSHVSACPNHQTLRVTPMETRFHVAAFGLLGYECNLSELSSRELDEIKVQVAFYKEHRETMQYGTFYRLMEDKEGTYQWCVVSKDQKDAIAMNLEKAVIPNMSLKKIRLKGLKEEFTYHFVNLIVPEDIRIFGSLINTASPIRIKENSLMHNIISKFVKVKGEIEDYEMSGEALMYGGVKLKQSFAGIGFNDDTRVFKDFSSRLYVVHDEASSFD